MATRRIDTNDPDFEPTERIEVDGSSGPPTGEIGDDTEVELPEWAEETVSEADHLPLVAMSTRARGVVDRLRRAGVKARRSSSLAKIDRNRRADTELAQRFDKALDMLTGGDLEGAFYTFTELLEERPQSTRLWIFVRAISQAKNAGE